MLATFLANLNLSFSLSQPQEYHHKVAFYRVTYKTDEVQNTASYSHPLISRYDTSEISLLLHQNLNFLFQTNRRNKLTCTGCS